jgi:hypothetical protein
MQYEATPRPRCEPCPPVLSPPRRRHLPPRKQAACAAAAAAAQPLPALPHRICLTCLPILRNEAGDLVDLYIPRKCSMTNRLIHAGDHAAVQFNVGHVSEDGCGPIPPAHSWQRWAAQLALGG